MPTRTGFRWWGRAWWSCRPRHSGKFLHPFAFSFVQIIAQVIEDGTVADLSLTIALRIIRRGESMGDVLLDPCTGYLLAKLVLLSEMIVWESLKQYTMFC